MADKPAKPASLLAPTSEATYGSLLEFLNGNVGVHTERGVNFTRVFQSARQIFWAHVGGKRQQFFQRLSSRSIRCSCSLYLTDLKQTELALNYNLLQLSGKFFCFFFVFFSGASSSCLCGKGSCYQNWPWGKYGKIFLKYSLGSIWGCKIRLRCSFISWNIPPAISITLTSTWTVRTAVIHNIISVFSTTVLWQEKRGGGGCHFHRFITIKQ